MHLLETPLFPIIFLLGATLLTAFSTTISILGKYNTELQQYTRASKLFFFQIFLKKFSGNQWTNIGFTISVTKHILNLLYATTAFFYALSILSATPGNTNSKITWGALLLIALIIICISLLLDYTMRVLVTYKPKAFLGISSFFSSIYLTICFPIVFLLLKLNQSFIKFNNEPDQNNHLLVRSKIEEILHESDLKMHLGFFEQKLLTSFLTFRGKLVKEIMIPRMDIFSIEGNISIREAAKKLAWQGYSRIPVYKEQLDNIIGVVLYKDVLDLYAESDKKPEEAIDLDSPLTSIVKPVLYAPENKKISQLLQEFRQKQSHLAIVVDEYGATEGIVTIEDILEELVGEIEDEYDFDEEQLFRQLADDTWIVDAKMSILDMEEKLGINIPHSTEYDTIGGYLSHRAGMIPSKGWKLQQDDFQIEVLSSDGRSLDKLQIISFNFKATKSLPKDSLQKKSS